VRSGIPLLPSEKKDQLTVFLSPWFEKARFRVAQKWFLGNQLLDIGCGNGVLSSYLPQGIQYVGLDSNRSYLIAARKRIPAGTFLAANLEDEPNLLDWYSANPFDCVIMLAVYKPKCCITKRRTATAQSGNRQFSPYSYALMGHNITLRREYTICTFHLLHRVIYARRIWSARKHDQVAQIRNWKVNNETFVDQSAL